MTHFNLTQKGTSKISGRGSKRVGGWWVERDSVAALVFSFALVCARGPHFSFCSALRLLQLLSLSAFQFSAKKPNCQRCYFFIIINTTYTGAHPLFVPLLHYCAKEFASVAINNIFLPRLVCNSPFNLPTDGNGYKKSTSALLGASPNEMSTHCQCTAFFFSLGKCLRLII